MKTTKGHSREAPEFKLVDAETLADRYGVAPKTIRKWGASGFLPVVKLSRRAVRYPLADCDKVIQGRRVNAVSEVAG